VSTGSAVPVKPDHAVTHAEHMVQEAHELHLALEARFLHDRVEDPLMEQGDLLAPLQVRSLERDEISIVGERAGEGRAIARIPSVDHPPMDGINGVLVSGSSSCCL
jgi:hypothetical protein